MSRTLKFNLCRKKLHALRSRLDACAPRLRDEAFHGAGGESAGDLSNTPIHQGERISPFATFRTEFQIEPGIFCKSTGAH